MTGPSLPRVVLYVHVSSEEQDLAGQEQDLRAYAKSKGWNVAKVYQEKVSARGFVLREEYERLLKDAKDPKRGWDRLLVWALDRWSREERFTRAVSAVEDLEVLGIHFHSFKEPMIDTTEDGAPNIGRDLLRAILPVIATFESRRRAERVRVAMEEIRSGRRRTRSGRPVGRPRRVFPEHEAKIQELRSQGFKWSKIAQLVGLPMGTCRKVRVQVEPPA